ncbi:unnamed protein product [Lactuca saligna]|uniref:DUF4283 domain-containing protein n=1 Tax=Lactuca saligna TaxID=75948 RepID=A0AA36DX63_LACSI|nr:unnamed protein product [Lactuca saligna]
MLCLDESFDIFEMRYIGGLWVLIEFTSNNACKNFLGSKAIDHWILENREWDRTFVPSERIVWVDVEGLPLSAWIKEPFRKILSKWGTIAQLDDDIGEDIYKKRICILTSNQSIISESNSSAVPGPTVNIPVAAAAEELQAAPATSPNPTVVTVVNFENSSAHAANSGLFQIGIDASNKPSQVGFSGGYICMLGIQSTDDSLSHPPGFSNMIHGEKDVFSEGSLTNDSNVVESKKTIAMGGIIGLNMSGCSEHVKNTIQEERSKEI